MQIRPIAIFFGASALLIVGFLLWWQGRHENRFDPVIRAASARYELPPSLIKAVIWKESDFNPAARGGKGEMGLMQLMDFTAQDWADVNRIEHFAHEHVLDPWTNTMAGCHYLARLRKRYGQTDNPFLYTLADYNAGRGNVLRWMKGAAATNSAAFLEQCEFPGTRQYVVAILNRREKYRRQFE